MIILKTYIKVKSSVWWFMADAQISKEQPLRHRSDGKQGSYYFNYVIRNRSTHTAADCAHLNYKEKFEDDII